MKINDIHIRNIKQANEEDRLAIFIGAGVSKSSDTEYIRLPSWSDLISELKSDLGITEEIDYLKLAQLYHLEFGEQGYHQALKKYFPEDITPSSLHRKILDLNPRVIITTNWDYIIENAIEQEGHLYDTICTDKDLVKSTSQKKFIKIHGDFKNHNIVFKEDDYLNYSRNFPLIENYIKSIFSTHTVLFLGYSYNDINLKHIMKWVQSHSTSAPPMYLVNFTTNKPQESYLRNHGITTIILDSENFPINEIDHLEERSALTQSFLTTIIQDDRAVEISDEQDIINFIYERIKHFKQQNSIDHNQISESLTNCRYLYERDGFIILDLLLPKGILTTDYSDSLRIIYKKFLDILSKIDLLNADEINDFYKNNPKFSDIFSILALARIKGICLPSENVTGQRMYFVNEKIDLSENIEKQDRKHISFSTYECTSHDFIKSLSSETYEHYKNGDYESAFKKNSELIIACKRHRIYSMLLIALFNKNSILWNIKYSFVENKNNFENEIKVNLQDEFFRFPRSEIKKNQTLYEFLSLHSVYRKANQCTKKILDLTNTVESIKNGGISFNSEADEPISTHINLLMFALKNHIMIDRDAAYRAAIRDSVKISILRQSVKELVKFNQYEIYSAIQFYSAKELNQELSSFLKKKDSINYRLQVNDECLEWIIEEILPNLTDRLIHNGSTFNSHGDRFVNCVRIIALLDLNDEHISKIINEFSRLIASSSTTIGTYDAINAFLAHQHNLFKRKIKNDILIKVLDNIIDKIIHKKAHNWDHHAILNQSINNLYGYINLANGKYSDKNRVSQLVSILQSYEIEDKRKYSKSLLYSIFLISDAPVRRIIKKFINDVIFKPITKSIIDWDFALWSVAVDFQKFDSGLINKLDEYLNKYRDGKEFSSKLYSMKDFIQYLIDNKKITELEDLNRDLENIINRFKLRPNQSSI